MSSDKLLLSYKDADIYQRDADLFVTPNWLNDSCINFYFKIIEDSLTNDSIALIDPSVVSFMMIQATDDEDIEELANSLRLNERKWLIVPVNDNLSFSQSSTHWSLLMFHVPTGDAVHIDSHNNYNKNAAISIARKLLTMSGSTNDLKVADVQCPQQTNGFDCGIYLLMHTEAVISLLSNEIDFNVNGDMKQLSEALQARVTPSSATEFRAAAISIIQQMSRK